MAHAQGELLKSTPQKPTQESAEHGVHARAPVLTSQAPRGSGTEGGAKETAAKLPGAAAPGQVGPFAGVFRGEGEGGKGTRRQG